MKYISIILIALSLTSGTSCLKLFCEPVKDSSGNYCGCESCQRSRKELDDEFTLAKNKCKRSGSYMCTCLCNELSE